MGRLRLLVLVLCVTAGMGAAGRSASAQTSVSSLSPAQQVLARYLVPDGTAPSGLTIAGISPLDNVLVGALAEDPREVQKIITRARLDGLEQDFSQSNNSSAQIQLQLSLFRDSTGSSADVGDPSLLAGTKLTPVAVPHIGDTSAAYTTSDPAIETNNLVFTAGRVEVLVSEVGPAGSTKQSDILPLARLMESRTRAPAPAPTSDELAVLDTQTQPESILHDAYELLLQNYLSKLPPSQVLGAAYDGATTALNNAGVANVPAAPTITATDTDAAWSQFLPAYQALEKLAPSSLSNADLGYAADTALYDNLNCHTSFFPPTLFTRETAEIQGSQEARIGILLQKFPDGSWIIRRVEPNTPAESAGLRAGDVVLAVDHMTPADEGDHFTDLFIGTAGSPMTLTIQRQAAQPFDLTITRQLINPVIAQHRVLPGGIGYMELDEFSDGDESVTGLQSALSDFAAAGNVNSWILDLRFNSGGSERTLQKVAGLFVAPGSLIITETEQDGTVTVDQSLGTPPPGQKSMVLLIGPETASAAEIFAQSMKDLGRVSLVGETTSGCVNGGLPLGLLDGSGVFVSTIDVRSGPKKVALENVGVTPDEQTTASLSDIQACSDPVLNAAITLFGGPVPAPQTSSGTDTRPAGNNQVQPAGMSAPQSAPQQPGQPAAPSSLRPPPQLTGGALGLLR
jgi:C-terminal peptidase prc